MKRHSKRYREAVKAVAPKPVPVEAAVETLKKLPHARFDESVDLNIRLGVNPADLQAPVRGTVLLPHGTGKTIRVAVFCRGEAERQARDAGADEIGGTELIEKVAGGWCEFDVAVATPDMMKDLSRLGKILGPRGLMPNPKSGTVTQDVAKAVKDVKRGRVEFKMDKQGCVNLAVGKLSFESKALAENIMALLNALVKARPKEAKGEFVQSISVATTMGPGLRLDVAGLVTQATEP